MVSFEIPKRQSADLLAARQQASFDPQSVAVEINDPAELESKKKLLAVVKNDPTFYKGDRAYLSRKERLYSSMKLMHRLFELADEKGWTRDELMAAYLYVDEINGLNLHEVAFAPVLANQASDEQQEKWLGLATHHGLLGCYMQTELGHGSNVQGLETTATYDKKTQEFVINSPTVTATKWWIGGLGFLSTHGVVQARLIIDGKELGPHLFFVQLRDTETHATLPRIDIGEIGPKALSGYSTVDNGWVRFNQLRIPRENMLNRFAAVAPDGAYSKPPHSKISYGGMLYIRAQMIKGLAGTLSKAVTIATRYLHVRHQFANAPGEAEAAVITYPGVYMRILPIVARAYAFNFIGKDVFALYRTMSEQLKRGDASLLPETHAIAATLKTYCTTRVVEGVEASRRSLGGHGYSDANGIGPLYANILPSVTYEGENYVLHMQTARAMLKALREGRADPTRVDGLIRPFLRTVLTPGARYVTADAWDTPAGTLHALELRAALRVEALDAAIEKRKLAWHDCSHLSVAVSTAVGDAYVAARIVALLDAQSAPVRAILSFFVTDAAAGAIGDFAELGVAVGPVLTALRERHEAQAAVLRPDLIAYTDAFAFDDYELNTYTSNYNGHPYESMFERARSDIDKAVGDASTRDEMFVKYVKPILKRGQRLASETKL